MKNKGLLKKIAKPLGICLLTGVLAFIPVKKANAGSVLNAPLSDGTNTNFQVSCVYSDTSISCLFKQKGGFVLREHEGFGSSIGYVLFGDENNTTIPTNWNQTVTTNVDTSERYDWTREIFGTPIRFTNSQSFSVGFDGSAPSGIGSMALDGYLFVSVTDGYGNVFSGDVAAPSAITTYTPTVVLKPSPLSSLLLAVEH
jgi:hypothetical protein